MGFYCLGALSKGEITRRHWAGLSFFHEALLVVFEAIAILKSRGLLLLSFLLSL